MNVQNIAQHTESQLNIENADVLNLFSQFSQPTLKYKEQLHQKLFETVHNSKKSESTSTYNPAVIWKGILHSSQTIPAIKYVTALTNRFKAWKTAA